MEISIETTNDCQAKLLVTVNAEDLGTIKNKITAGYLKSANIPGFRPGKAPLKVVAKRYATMIDEELEHRIREDIQEETLKQNPELKVLDFGTPEAGVQEDGSYSLSTMLTIIPTFELPEYMGLKVTVPVVEPTDEEVQDTLTKYAESLAKYEPVERPAAMGDITVVDFTTSIEGKPVAEYCGKPVGFMEGREGHWVNMEEDAFMPGLAEGLVGANAGDTREITISLKEDFPLSDIAGKDVTFECKVTEVREKIVPELNEELFESALPGKTLDEIKEIVRENMKQGNERSNDELMADQISEQIADQLSFPLPEDLVERENDNTVQRKVYAAIQSGDYELAKNADQLREESKGETERNLRVYFAIQEIATRENVVATDQEMFQQIAEMAEQAKESNLQKFMRKLSRENRLTGIRLSIVTSKVLALLAKNAEVEYTERTAATESSEGSEA